MVPKKCPGCNPVMGSPPSDFKACLLVTLAIEEMKALGKSVCREGNGVGSSVFHPKREDHSERYKGSLYTEPDSPDFRERSSVNAHFSQKSLF